jgi:fatty acid desaturase
MYRHFIILIFLFPFVRMLRCQVLYIILLFVFFPFVFCFIFTRDYAMALAFEWSRIFSYNSFD